LATKTAATFRLARNPLMLWLVSPGEATCWGLTIAQPMLSITLHEALRGRRCP
jgi:hypothetical protein